MQLPVLLGITFLAVFSCVNDSKEKTPHKETISSVVSEENLIKSANSLNSKKLPEDSNSITKRELLNDFIKPLYSYPKIKSSMAKYGSDGLLYRQGIDIPFNGRLIDENSNGVAILESSFLDGQPHGQQLRRNEQGKVIMEAIFDRGVLTGIKTMWWPNGLVREEEYWDRGSYKGRKVWDESGRLIKEERVE